VKSKPLVLVAPIFAIGLGTVPNYNEAAGVNNKPSTVFWK